MHDSSPSLANTAQLAVTRADTQQTIVAQDLSVHLKDRNLLFWSNSIYIPEAKQEQGYTWYMEPFCAHSTF